MTDEEKAEECADWIKQKQKDEMKNKISMALKDPMLQQGFEIICKENAELKAKIEKMIDCSNCKHWHYSTRLLAYVCDCSDKISDSIDSRTYEYCDKWEIK